MRTRRIIAIVLAIAALPLVVFGLIDPLEGGLALLGAIVLVLMAWALARVAVPKLAWIPALATVLIGAAVLAIAILTIPADPQPDPGTVMAPGGGILVALLWVYRFGVLITLAGAVLYLVYLFQSLRTTAMQPTVSVAGTPGSERVTVENERNAASRTRGTRPPGSVGMLIGAVAALAALAVGVISFTPADPPTWIRIATFWLLILSIPLSIVFGAAARHDGHRVWGVAGAGLGGLALIALIVMMSIA